MYILQPFSSFHSQYCYCFFPPLSSLLSRTSMFALAAFLCQRLTSQLPASMWPRLIAGLWRSCVWRSMSPLHRVPHWMPAALASKVRQNNKSFAANGICRRQIFTLEVYVCECQNTQWRFVNVASWFLMSYVLTVSPRSETARSHLCQ